MTIYRIFRYVCSVHTELIKSDFSAGLSGDGDFKGGRGRAVGGGVRGLRAVPLVLAAEHTLEPARGHAHVDVLRGECALAIGIMCLSEREFTVKNLSSGGFTAVGEK